MLGGDVVFASAALAAANLAAAAAAAAPSLCYDVCAWSMERLPLRTASQDIVTCDLPFGVAHLDARAVSRLYPRCCKEVSRVLRVGGRAVLMGRAACTHARVSAWLHGPPYWLSSTECVFVAQIITW